MTDPADLSDADLVKAVAEEVLGRGYNHNSPLPGYDDPGLGGVCYESNKAALAEASHFRELWNKAERTLEAYRDAAEDHDDSR